MAFEIFLWLLYADIDDGNFNFQYHTYTLYQFILLLLINFRTVSNLRYHIEEKEEISANPFLSFFSHISKCKVS